MEACEEEEDDDKAGNHLGTVRVDDSGRRRRGKEHRKLNACHQSRSPSNFGIKFHSNKNCYGLRNALMSFEALKSTKCFQSEEPGPSQRV